MVEGEGAAEGAGEGTGEGAGTASGGGFAIGGRPGRTKHGIPEPPVEFGCPKCRGCVKGCTLCRMKKGYVLHANDDGSRYWAKITLSAPEDLV